MSLRPLIVMYEDSHGPRTGFGLHELVVRCVYEQFEEHSEIEFYQASKALSDFRPMKGDSALLNQGCYQAKRIGRSGHPIIAVFDNDKIRRLLKLPHTITDEDVIATIRNKSGAGEQLHIVLLHENTESLLETIAQHDPAVTEAQRALAIDRKNLSQRDLMLGGAGKEARRNVRDRLLDENESFREFIALLAHLVDAD